MPAAPRMRRRAFVAACLYAASLLTTAPADSSSSSPFRRPSTLFGMIPRGGGGAAASAKVNDNSLLAYRLQQQLYLESRSIQLRQLLLSRGLTALQHGDPTTTNEATTRKKVVDWDCALATLEYPKSCLYSFDAQPGTKVVAPINTTTQWITLTALNRLRRTDPSKVEPLWHDQYAILSSWLHPESPYSLYPHLSPAGMALSLLLDVPHMLGLALIVAIALGIVITLPVWEAVAQMILTSSSLWLNWPQWGRFLHAALPLKLLLGQMAWKALAASFDKVYKQVRDRLVELECQLWQESIPLTILEGEMAIEEEERLLEDLDQVMLEEEEEEEDDVFYDALEQAIDDDDDDDDDDY